MKNPAETGEQNTTHTPLQAEEESIGSKISPLSTAGKWRKAYIALTVFLGIFCTAHIISRVIPHNAPILCDFKFRYAEVLCLRQGIDPFKIWNEEQQLAGFPSLSKKAPGRDPKKDPNFYVWTYTPWTYSLIYPFTFVNYFNATVLYHTLQTLCLLGIFSLSFLYGKRLRGDWVDGLFVALSSQMIGPPLSEDFNAGNFGTLITGAAVLLVYFLERKRQTLAGLCWAVMMIKPQMGVLFFIPLILGRQFVAIGVAIATTLLLAIPPSLMCGDSPLTMILNAAKVGSASYTGTLLIPGFLGLQGNLSLTLSAVLGIAICFALSIRLRNREDWLLKFAPVIMCALFWTYSTPHDLMLLTLPIVYIAKRVVLAKSTRQILLGLIVLFLLWHNFLSYLNIRWTFMNKLAAHWQFLNEALNNAGFQTILGYVQYSAMAMAFVAIAVITAGRSDEGTLSTRFSKPASFL